MPIREDVICTLNALARRIHRLAIEKGFYMAIGCALVDKLDYNENRPFRHGKAY